MQAPLDVRFQNFAPSPTIEAAVREHFGALKGLAPDLMSCCVTIDSPHRHGKQRNLFVVTIDFRFAGGEVVASRHPSSRHADEDAFVAVRDAFHAARRQLEDRVRVRRDHAT